MEGGRNTDGTLRVLLADDHTMFRQGLARLLDSHDGIEVVAWVPNDDEVSELARELRPDVVVMEVRVGLEEAGVIGRGRLIPPSRPSGSASPTEAGPLQFLLRFLCHEAPRTP